MIDTSLLTSITGLALADSVNPCEMAVLLIVLVTILTKNPENRKKVLYAGLAFVSAIFIGYLIYAFLLIQFFSFLTVKISGFSVYVYNGLAIFSMIMGALNIKDYFYYKPGSFATEMPLSFRPRVKMMIKGIASTKGAFVIGILVTLFVLPCTAGPLFVASGLLSEIGIMKSIPWVLYYNFIFVLPMLIIVAFVYFSYKKVDEISGWKERNIKRLHLVAGILLFLVGLSLLMGWL